MLAAGLTDGLIGETGTGCGVGLAWMVAGAGEGTRLVSVELDENRAARAAMLFADLSHVEVIHGDAAALVELGPFDLLVLDGGPGSGKVGERPIDPLEVLTPHGVLVIDDFTPMTSWPPRMPDGAVDAARLHWLEHPDLVATEVTVGPSGTAAVIVARRRPPPVALDGAQV